jgi:catechol 2,3-dioxygenase-like lactoylglutathione lyase family enzyme
VATEAGAAPLGELAYLYVGVDDVDRAVAFYGDALGAERVWRFQAFGTEVAAVRLTSAPPLVLLAEHRSAPSVLPIWTVDDLDVARDRIAGSGFETRGETVGTPDGPVHVFRDPDGNELGLLLVERPHALDAAYADPDNARAVREPDDP